MRALIEYVELLRGTVALWWRFFPVLGFWFLIGWALREFAIQATVVLGAKNAVPANLIFVLGLVAWVICLVLMIASLGPALRFDKNPSLKAQFAGLSSQHSRQDLLAHGATPFLAVYALGGFAAEQVGEVQRSALLWLGPDFVVFQPVRFEQWPTYLGILVVAWILLRLIGLLHARRPNTLTGIGQVIAKGTVVLSAFIVVTELLRRAGDWITTRVLWDWVQAAWRGLLDVLPDWRLPLIDLTLPAALEQFVFTVIPGAFGAVLMPLTWLALTACVFGWRDLTSNLLGTSETERALLTRGDRVAASRIGQRVRGAFAAGPLRFAWRQAQGLAEDYLPLGQGVRIIARAGAHFVAAYLVASATLALLERGFQVALRELYGPQGLVSQMVADPFLRLPTALVFTTLSVALYARAFDRAILAAGVGSGRVESAESEDEVTPSPSEPVPATRAAEPPPAA
ncbi:hypothetical protein AADG42_02330 [Ammonicoccus fulvus]|uniref:ABC transporter permease n=1 Tax=Ammonicoccus fulvus TaxID=3138240 RepID=A0ABZ3FMZ7_9ACTN